MANNPKATHSSTRTLRSIPNKPWTSLHRAAWLNKIKAAPKEGKHQNRAKVVNSSVLGFKNGLCAAVSSAGLCFLFSMQVKDYATLPLHIQTVESWNPGAITDTSDFSHPPRRSDPNWRDSSPPPSFCVPCKNRFLFRAEPLKSHCVVGSNIG
jgi:hypothetical protein